MNRTIKLVLAVIFVLLITFSAISIFQTLGKRLKVDVTDRGLYTLSAGTRSILGKLNQPIKFKLYYAKTAAMKAPTRLSTTTTTMNSSKPCLKNTLPPRKDGCS